MHWLIVDGFADKAYLELVPACERLNQPYPVIKRNRICLFIKHCE